VVKSGKMRWAGFTSILSMGDMLTYHNDELHSSCAAVSRNEIVAILNVLIAVSKIQVFLDIRPCRLVNTFE
jgi:hypothetical protein